jgi:hypothetical protein
MKMKEFLYAIDKAKPDFFKDLKNDHPPRIDYRKYQESELDAEELSALRGVQKEFHDDNYNTYITVEKTIDNSIKWTNPFLIDAQLIFDHDARIKEIKTHFESKELEREKKRKANKKRSSLMQDTEEEEEAKPDTPTPSEESEPEVETPEVWVFPCFMKTGKYKFLVQDTDNQYYLHRKLCP